MHNTDLSEYNWKQAASQESVDYQAVESTFMTQAYGFVANKAKVLFRDPFRLGFEIVHRNEKATKMVGIFAFRCNKSLLYAPVFFVNGEIKGADMLYRSDVKRFIPLTEEWCSFLVRGANEEAGVLQKRDGQIRQVDSNMHRLAYPQRVKYASDVRIDKSKLEPQELIEIEKIASGELFREIMLHCSKDDSGSDLLIPRALKDGGPEALMKLASLIEDSDIASRFVAETYTEAELTPDWTEKSASVEKDTSVTGKVMLVRDINLTKSANARKDVATKGYTLEDYRELGAVNSVVTNLEDPVIKVLNTPGVVSVMDVDGNDFEALLSNQAVYWLEGDRCPVPSDETGAQVIISLDSKPCEFKRLDDINRRDTFGSYVTDTAKLDKKMIKPSKAKVGFAYVLIRKNDLTTSRPFMVKSKEGKNIELCTLFGSPSCSLIYKADAEHSDPTRGMVNDDFALIEIEVKGGEIGHCHDTVWSKKLMTPAGLDKWVKTGGGATHSKEITVTKEPNDLFTISAIGSDGFRKVARSLDRMKAHISLAGDYEMKVDKAGEILDMAEDKDVYRFRLYDTVNKSAFTTRMHPEQEWVSGYDTVLGTKLNFPQEQRVSTYTPERRQQHARVGDVYKGEAPKADYDEEEDGLPPDAIMSMTPEALATAATKYEMPHIFDHQVISGLAGNTYDTIEQVRNYIPDLETGVDRFARILFLLRYRPADFEEAYGKDELMEMEQELSSLFALSGKNLLRMLKRFDSDKFSQQSDS